jgi:hypothetical protein
MNRNKLKSNINEYMQSHTHKELFEIIIEVLDNDANLKLELVQKLYSSIKVVEGE